MKPSDVRGMIDRGLNSVRQALRATWTKVSDDQVMLVQGEGLNDERFEGMEWFQQPGFRSKPADKDAELVVVPLHGKSAHGVVIASANGKLFVTELQAGETAIFHEGEGHFIQLKNGKIINIECDTLNVKAATAINFETTTFTAKASASTKIDSPTTETTGAMTSDGLLTFNAGLTGKAGAGGGAAASIAGTLKTTGGDIVADDISLKNHKTSGVQSGNNTSGAPIP